LLVVRPGSTVWPLDLIERRSGAEHTKALPTRWHPSGSRVNDTGTPDEPLRWPWPALDALTGGMMPGTVWYLVAFSGLGKSTFLRSAILGWARQGIGIDVLPLETTATNFKVDMAALLAKVDPGLITSGDYQKLPDGAEIRERVAENYRYCQREMYYDPERGGTSMNPIRVRNLPRINVEGLWQCARDAKERQGCRALLVDHIDHVQSAGRSPFDVSKEVNEAALDIAKELGLTMILSSQANNDALKGNNDYLVKYGPLRDSSVWMGSLKRQIATGMIGLFRPVREPHRDESAEDFAALVKRVRQGAEAPSSVLLSGAMGVSLMKSRSWGSREGQRVTLGWKQGEVVDYEQLPYSLR